MGLSLKKKYQTPSNEMILLAENELCGTLKINASFSEEELVFDVHSLAVRPDLNG